MKSIEQVTALVIDSGLFLPFARRMAEDCKRVIFYNPDHNAFPSLRQGCIGDGFEGIQHTLDFWPHLDEIDLVCFPDIGHSGLQMHLESIGKAVWGSRRGDSIEIRRQFFMGVLKDIGLQVPEYTAVTGLDSLAEHLRDKEDQYIKVSRWRGDMETTHFRNWTLDRGWLDWMAVNLGPLKDHLVFLVFPKIDTDLEIGCDTFFINDRFPNLMLSGIESKDSCYFGAVRTREEMPNQITEILSAITPFLADRRYCNQISFEVRVKDDQAFYIDATQRAGMPSSASQQLLWTNFPTIVWAGANGEFIEPVPAAKFSIEAMVTSKGSKDCWDVVELPEALERSCRFSHCAFVDGCYVFPPDEFHGGELGWICATADTPSEALELVKQLTDQLPDGLSVSIEDMAELINEVETAEEVGISLVGEKMPEIEEVVT